MANLPCTEAEAADGRTSKLHIDRIAKRGYGRCMASYYVIQTDDEGWRIVSESHTTARGAALSVAGLATWINVDDLAATWNANHPDGGESYQIGCD